MRAIAAPRRLSSQLTLGLGLALLCAWSGCLNPRPEEYPSDTASPGAEGASGPADNARQAPDFESNVAEEGEPTAAPNDPAQQAPVPVEPPSSLLPDAPPSDAGVDADAGPADAGAPAIAE